MVVGGALAGTLGGIEVAPPKAVAEWGSGDGGVLGRVEGRGKGGLSIDDAGSLLLEGLTGGWAVIRTGASNICGSLLCVFSLEAWRTVSCAWRTEARRRVDARRGLRRAGGATVVFGSGISGGARVCGRVVVVVLGRSMVVLVM